MSDAPAWYTPAAIVFAGALVGLGAYFGLAANQTEATSGTSPTLPAEAATAPPNGRAANGAAAAVATETSVPAPAAPPPAPARPAVADVEGATKAVLAELEKAKPNIVKNCWDPSFAKNPEPASVTVGVNMAFRTSGKLVGSGVAENREASRPDMFDCLAAEVHKIEIPPQPANVSVEVSLTLP